jgi:SAM-dependent methyltransferase
VSRSGVDILDARRGRHARPHRPALLSGVRVRLVLGLRRWIERVRATLGIRRGVHVRDRAATIVYYKELSAEPLVRALSRRGRGFKDYRATFADGSKMLVRCSPGLCYADLMGPEGLHRYEQLAGWIRPGGRVLDVPPTAMSTGYTGAYLAGLVGSAGSVVCVLVDEAGAAFAGRRYPPGAGLNLALEAAAGPEDIAVTMAGEVEGAFDAIIVLEPTQAHAPLPTLVRELARLLAPGGRLMLGDEHGPAPLHPEFVSSLGLVAGERVGGATVLTRIQHEPGPGDAG